MFDINRFSVHTFEVKKGMYREGIAVFICEQAVVSQVGVQKKEESS